MNQEVCLFNSIEQRLSVSMRKKVLTHCRIGSFRVLRQSFCGKFEFSADSRHPGNPLLECMHLYVGTSKVIVICWFSKVAIAMNVLLPIQSILSAFGVYNIQKSLLLNDIDIAESFFWIFSQILQINHDFQQQKWNCR